MALDNEKLLDETGWHLLHELQQNARLSFSELGQRVGLSSPAIAERMRRMEDAGIITGYHAEVNPAKLGFPVMAIIRMTSLASAGKYAGASSKQVYALVNQFPEVIESYRATGSDITLMKVLATSVEHLDDVIERLAELGQTTTSILLSPPTIKKITPKPEEMPRSHTDHQ
jgi:Lrp/AsnC family transcriptional regulator, leucine-responsive regulatory protein